MPLIYTQCSTRPNINLKSFEREYLFVRAYIAIFFNRKYPFNKQDAKYLTEKIIKGNYLNTLKQISPLLAESFIRMYTGVFFAKFYLLLDDIESYESYLKALYFYSGAFVERCKVLGFDTVSNDYLLQPYKKYTQELKNIAIPLAKEIWSYDTNKILLRKHVADIITKLLPQHNLRITQVDNWLKQSDIVPNEILERYKNNDYGNSKPIVEARERLKAEILLKLTPLYCEDM